MSEMRKKQDINIACKKDLDRQVCEMKDFENLIKNQVSYHCLSYALDEVTTSKFPHQMMTTISKHCSCKFQYELYPIFFSSK